MYDLERLHHFITNPINSRRSGKTVALCFYLAGLVDLSESDRITLTFEYMDRCWHFSDELKHVFIFMGINWSEKSVHGRVLFEVKDNSNRTKEISLVSRRTNNDFGYPIDQFVIHVDSENINNCYIE